MPDSPNANILRAYGVTNGAEFFVVATEPLCERPDDMQSLTLGLLAELARFYGHQP